MNLRFTLHPILLYFQQIFISKSYLKRLFYLKIYIMNILHKNIDYLHNVLLDPIFFPVIYKRVSH